MLFLHLGYISLTYKQPPNDRYEARQMAAAQRSRLQNDCTQDFHYQHAGRMNDAHGYLHHSQFIGRDFDSDTRVESSVGVIRHEPQHLSDLPDESTGQIIHSDSYHDGCVPGLHIYGHFTSPEVEAWTPPTTIANTSEDGNYPSMVMAESEEEGSHDEDAVFDVASEEESTDDERGFEGDDEGGDTPMDESEGEYEDENGEAMHTAEEVYSITISRSSTFDRNDPAVFYGEEIWEVEWPSGTWYIAFNRIEQD